MRKVKLLLIDSCELYRLGMTKLLRSDSNITIESMSCIVSEVTEAARVYKPDVVLLDILNSESVKVMSCIQQILPGAHIMILTNSKEGKHFFSALNAGATGYIFKDVSYGNLLHAIDFVNGGKLVIDQAIAALVVNALKFLDKHRHLAEPSYISLLSEQEKVILSSLVQEATNKEIASTLHITESTVKVHVHNILAKLQARNRFEASVSAIEEGLECDVTEAGTKLSVARSAQGIN